MKKFLATICILLFSQLLLAQENIIMNEDVTVNSVGTINNSFRLSTGIIQEGKDITASGILRIPIVFVKFSDDVTTTSYWPVANTLPTWAATFIDSQIPTNGIYANNNFSKFYDLSSGGNGSGALGRFQVIGDVYFVNLPNSRAYYDTSRKDAGVSADVINILDTQFNVDFRIYDNWEFKVEGEYYNHSYRPYNSQVGLSADGKIDFMVIYWKDASIELNSNVGGRADLGLSENITKDGVTISSSNGIIGYKAQIYGLERTLWVTAHEIGHHQFGMYYGNTYSHFNGWSTVYGNIQQFGLMTTAEGHQFSAYERYRLGWLAPTVITTNTTNLVINETHKNSINNAVLIPVAYDPNGYLKEYFLIENYHSTAAYIGANPFLISSLFNHIISKGLIVYHVADENYDWPTLSKIDIESAEGLYNWLVIQGGNTPTNRLDDLIAPGAPNLVNGFDERGKITATAGTITYNDYLALTPGSTNNPAQWQFRRYSSDDWLGDQEDLFSLDYNKVFSTWSNPGSGKDNGRVSYKGFEIVSYNAVAHQYIINVGVDYNGILNLAPSKPQNLKVQSSSNSHPLLSWNANGEPDIANYKVYKKITEEVGWQLLATTTANTYEDLSESYQNLSYSHPIWYRIVAVDTQTKYSLPSNEVETIVEGAFLEKSTSEEIVAVLKYAIAQNYPNPFNPSTNITFQIPTGGNVSLKVYDVLGKEVAVLIDEYKDAGRYSVNFNGSNLASGIYLYKLQAGNFTSTKKLVLMK